MNIQNEQFTNTIALLYDKNFRADLQANPEQHASKLGYQLSDGQTTKIVVSTAEIFYLVLPDIKSISADNLQKIQAAGSASSVSSAGTLSTIASASSCASSLGTTSSAGTGATLG